MVNETRIDDEGYLSGPHAPRFFGSAGIAYGKSAIAGNVCSMIIRVDVVAGNKEGQVKNA